MGSQQPIDESISYAELGGDGNLPESNANVLGIIPDDKFYSAVLLCVFVPLSFFTVVENFRIVSVVITMPTKDRNNGNIIISHFSLVTILMTFSVGIYLLNKFGHLALLHNFHVICAGSSYLRNVLVSMIPLNIIAFNYEKVEFRKTYQGESLLLGRCIALIWLTAGVGNLPSIFTVKITQSSEQAVPKCEQQLFLGSLILSVLYEGLKLLIFMLLPVGYIFETLWQMRSKVVKYVFRSNEILNERIRRKMKAIQLLFLHGAFFLACWVPSRFLLFVYKVLTAISLDDKKDVSPWLSILMILFTIILFLYCSINAVTHLRLNGQMCDLKWYEFCYHSEKSHEDPEDIEMSPESTTKSCTEQEQEAWQRHCNIEQTKQRLHLPLEEMGYSMSHQTKREFSQSMQGGLDGSSSEDNNALELRNVEVDVNKKPGPSRGRRNAITSFQQQVSTYSDTEQEDEENEEIFV